jgi:PAS domain S-box-containing protein
MNQPADEPDQQTAASGREASDAATIGQDRDGVIHTWSRGAERLLGYRASEMLGAAGSVLVPPERREEAQLIHARLCRGEELIDYETVRLAKDGRRVDVSLTISPVRDEIGGIAGDSTTVEIVADGRGARAAVHLAAIVDSTDDAIVSKNLLGIIQTWNRGAERIFGYAAEEVVGRPITLLIPADRLSEEEDILARVRRGERVNHYETVRVRKDGLCIDVSLTISPLLDASGRVIGASKIAQDITERRRSEESRARLAAIVDSTDDAIVSKNLQGIIQSWNHGAERIFGYRADEAIGQPITLVIPPDRHAEEREILAKIARGERVDHYETIRVTRDGRRIEVSLTISPLMNAAGQVIGASKVGRDVTERNRMQRELALQRERFRVTLASIGDAVIAADVDGRVTFLNAVAEKLTGWPAEEACGRPLADVFTIISEETRERIEDPAQKVIRSGVILGLANHTALISRDGVESPIADSAAPIFDAGGKIIGVVLTFRDISEERRAEEALHEQREWFEQTLQGIGDGVIATDIRGSVVFMNPVAEFLTGRTLEDSRGRSCADVFRILNEKTRSAVENPVGRVLREGKVEGLAAHALLVDAQGNGRHVDLSGAPIRNSSGRLVGAVLMFRDVSERQAQELERAAAASERERLLEGERAARAAAERANRVKDDFVATLSHELRTPLNAILGWTQILKSQEALSELVARGMDVIERNTRVQAQLVADLLDMSRIMSGKLSLEIRKVDLGSIVEAAVETVQPAALLKGVTLHTQIDRGTGPLAGDAARLQQIVWNLLSNAIKFTPEGGRVEVSLERLDDQAHVVVRDNGIGIHADFLPALFERFRQAESATSRRFGGLGLGLAIVKQLTELHGGTVEASSEGEGRGSTFRVRFPIGSPRSASASEQASGTAAAVSVDDEVGLRGLRVLVVEDDADTADLLDRFLRNAGGAPLVVHSAEAALDAMRASVPDIVVSDIGMPGVDGYELMRRIRKLEPGQGGTIPAIAVTAFARMEDRMRALLAGYQAHLSKPVDAAELVATVRTLSGLTLGRRPGLEP